MANTDGAIVRNVGQGGPADLAGVEPGDVIVSFNNLPVAQVRDLTTAVAETRVGAATTMEVVRDGERLVLDISVARRTAAALAQLGVDGDKNDKSGHSDNPLASFGLRVEALNAEDMARLGFDRYRSGLLVAEVQEDAIFDPRDLQAGDIILEVDQKNPASAADFAAALERAFDTGATLMPMIVIRDGQRNWIAPRLQN